jgi:hypothetical protein
MFFCEDMKALLVRTELFVLYHGVFADLWLFVESAVGYIVLVLHFLSSQHSIAWLNYLDRVTLAIQVVLNI